MDVDKQVRDFGKIFNEDDPEIEVEVEDGEEVDDLKYYVG